MEIALIICSSICGMIIIIALILSGIDLYQKKRIQTDSPNEKIEYHHSAEIAWYYRYSRLAKSGDWVWIMALKETYVKQKNLKDDQIISIFRSGNIPDGNNSGWKYSDADKWELKPLYETEIKNLKTKGLNKKDIEIPKDIIKLYYNKGYYTVDINKLKYVYSNGDVCIIADTHKYDLFMKNKESNNWEYIKSTDTEDKKEALTELFELSAEKSLS